MIRLMTVRSLPLFTVKTIAVIFTSNTQRCSPIFTINIAILPSIPPRIETVTMRTFSPRKLGTTFQTFLRRMKKRTTIYTPNTLPSVLQPPDTTPLLLEFSPYTTIYMPAILTTLVDMNQRSTSNLSIPRETISSARKDTIIR